VRGGHHQRVRWRVVHIFLHVITGCGVARVVSSSSFAGTAGTASLRL
jgi:hypothetical protein